MVWGSCWPPTVRRRLPVKVELITCSWSWRDALVSPPLWGAVWETNLLRLALGWKTTDLICRPCSPSTERLLFKQNIKWAVRGRQCSLWPWRLLKLRRLSHREIFQHQGLFLFQCTDFWDVPHICIVMFDSVIPVHLAERLSVDWCCTSRLMCENPPINSEMYCTASVLSEKVFQSEAHNTRPTYWLAQM